MNLDRLHEIINETTVQLRNGPEIVERKEGPIDVVEVFAMPHVDAVTGLEKVDLTLLTVGVDKAKAEAHKDGLIALLKAYPEPERLAAGPSYIEVGGVLGDQGAAFQLFALGKVLGLWDIVTPATFGFDGVQACEMAGMGHVMITGFRSQGENFEMLPTIWKFPLTESKRQVIHMPAGARLLTVATQHNIPTLWAEVDPEKGMVARKIFIRGTGHEMGEATDCPHVATILLQNDLLVWHIFDGGEMPQ